MYPVLPETDRKVMFSLTGRFKSKNKCRQKRLLFFTTTFSQKIHHGRSLLHAPQGVLHRFAQQICFTAHRASFAILLQTKLSLPRKSRELHELFKVRNISLDFLSEFVRPKGDKAHYSTIKFGCKQMLGEIKSSCSLQVFRGKKSFVCNKMVKNARWAVVQFCCAKP